MNTGHSTAVSRHLSEHLQGRHLQRERLLIHDKDNVDPSLAFNVSLSYCDNYVRRYESIKLCSVRSPVVCKTMNTV